MMKNKLYEGSLNLNSDYIPDVLKKTLKEFENNLRTAFEEIKSNKALKKENKEMVNFIRKNVNIIKSKTDSLDKKIAADSNIYETLKIIADFYKKVFDKATGTNVTFEFDYEDVKTPVINAFYKKNVKITYFLNVGYFFDIMYADTEDLINELMIIYHHELIHSIQHTKHNDKKLPKKIPKYVKSIDTYITTPMEIPAQAQTLASIFYYDANKDVDKALENMRSLTLNKKKVGALDDIYNAIIKNKNNKKVKRLISYAYLNLYAMKEIN